MEHLHAALGTARQCLPPIRVHGLTMTAELADIFPDRWTGVRAVLAAGARHFGDVPVRVYGFGGWLDIAAAAESCDQVASANWHATAQLAAALLEEGILVDIGSTTTDIIPFSAGQPRPRGYTDQERMRYDELLYTGVVRTPVMAVARRAPCYGIWQALAAEHFATMADVYRLTGDLTESDDMQQTADGAGKTPGDSARRLARMFGADLGDDDDLEPWRQAARYLAGQQARQIQEVLCASLARGLAGPEAPIVGAGCGRFLARSLADALARPYVDFSGLARPRGARNEISGMAATCAPAYAVAELVRRLHQHETA
jgi:probable H4MPT-linked C1 transfer pathway protein